MQIRRPATYTEDIRQNIANNITYVKNTTKKVEAFNKTGFNNIENHMTQHGVKQQFERYADGSADELRT